jgi:hypothetical protein
LAAGEGRPEAGATMSKAPRLIESTILGGRQGKEK